jgi:hypothetical protein
MGTGEVNGLSAGCSYALITVRVRWESYYLLTRWILGSVVLKRMYSSLLTIPYPRQTCNTLPNLKIRLRHSPDALTGVVAVKVVYGATSTNITWTLDHLDVCCISFTVGHITRDARLLPNCQ